MVRSDSSRRCSSSASPSTSAKGDSSESELEDARPCELGQRQRERARLEKLDPVVAEPQHVPGVLSAEAVACDQLGSDHAHLAALARHAVALPLHVAKVGAAGPSRLHPLREAP